MGFDSTALPPTAQLLRPLISIVVINYNYARFLRTAIDSALAQTYSDIEVIAVDDGSTDQSRDIIESYGGRIAPVLKSNGGHGSALNAGFAACRGDVVIFVDADDALLPTAAAEVANAWRQGVAKVQFQLEMVDAQGKPLGMRIPRFDGFVPNGDIRDRIARFGEYPSGASSGNAYARAALNQLMPLDEQTWFAAADKPLVLLAPFFGDVVSLCTPLGSYRIHEGNDSRLKGRHLEALHRRLSAAYFVPETICRIAASKGIELDSSVLGSTSRRLKLRMASIRIDPKTHPIMGDTRLGLLAAGVRTSFREPDLSPGTRGSQIMWFVLMAIAPMAIVGRLTAPAR